MLRQVFFVFSFALVAALSAWPITANAQSWAYYMNDEHQFSGLFPGEPVGHAINYTTDGGASIAAHEFTAQRGKGQYSITIVDFSEHMNELETAVANAAANVRERGMPAYDEFAQLNGIPGHAISIADALEASTESIARANEAVQARLRVMRTELWKGDITTVARTQRAIRPHLKKHS
ncbi:MAG: hypothetical protein ACKVG0_12120, partial [Alphaproteobacteria bacterium]